MTVAFRSWVLRLFGVTDPTQADTPGELLEHIISEDGGNALEVGEDGKLFASGGVSVLLEAEAPTNYVPGSRQGQAEPGDLFLNYDQVNGEFDQAWTNLAESSGSVDWGTPVDVKQGDGPPVNGVTAGATGEVYVDVEVFQNEDTLPAEGIYVCTNGATDTWVAFTGNVFFGVLGPSNETPGTGAGEAGAGHLQSLPENGTLWLNVGDADEPSYSQIGRGTPSVHKTPGSAIDTAAKTDLATFGTEALFAPERGVFIRAWGTLANETGTPREFKFYAGIGSALRRVDATIPANSGQKDWNAEIFFFYDGDNEELLGNISISVQANTDADASALVGNGGLGSMTLEDGDFTLSVEMAVANQDVYCFYSHAIIQPL